MKVEFFKHQFLIPDSDSLRLGNLYKYKSDGRNMVLSIFFPRPRIILGYSNKGHYQFITINYCMFYVDKTTSDNLGFGNMEKYKYDAYKYKLSA